MVKYKGNFNKLSPDLHEAVAKLYATGRYTTEQLAKQYNVSTRQVQRIAKNKGVIRTQAEANKIAAPLKRYHTIPIEMRVKRKQLSQKLRYQVISANPYCVICGMRPNDGIRLEVDHIDENPMNNDIKNLQVLCGSCNTGKSHVSRYSYAYGVSITRKKHAVVIC